MTVIGSRQIIDFINIKIINGRLAFRIKVKQGIFPDRNTYLTMKQIDAEARARLLEKITIPLSPAWANNGDLI
jgi:hypothetical protein